MNFIYNFFIGTLIGCGAILPGVSSGVFLVIFGIYEKLVNIVLNFFKDFKKNFLFLLPIFLGALVGIIFFGNIIKYLFFNYKMQASFAFIGLILGTIPSLLKETSSHKCIKLKDFFPLIFSFILGICLIFLENNSNSNYFSNSINISFLYLVFSGFIMSIGIIIPGVSSTILLMLLGIYPIYINAVSTLNLNILIPLGIGVLIGSILWLKLIKYLLNNYHEKTFYSIIGFTLGSILILYPSFSFNLNGIISIFILIISTIISYKLAKHEKT